MRIMRQRLAAMALIGGLTTLGIGLMAGPASANVSTCDVNHYLTAAQSGSLHITSTPAAGSSVTPGSDIAVNAAWNDADFNETHALFVCGSVDGVFNSAMSSENQSVDNNGALAATATVPANAAPGSNVCVVAALVGQLPTTPVSQGQMVSEQLCYRVAEAATTTTTMAPTTTTTAPAVTQPADVGTTEAGTPSPPAEPAPAVAPEVVQAPAPAPVLPRTGSNTDALAGFGAVVLAIGGLARFFGRKRPSEA